MAQDGSGTRGKYASHSETGGCPDPMTYGVYAGPHLVEATAFEPVPDGLLADAGLDQLPPRHDSMLTLRQHHNELIDVTERFRPYRAPLVR